MRKFFIPSIYPTISVLILTLFFSVKVSACSCSVPLICEAYASAKAVFVGKLERLEENPQKFKENKIAYFRVEKTYKGKTEEIEQVSFTVGSCERKFTVGEKYFVYKTELPITNTCGRTELFSAMPSDVEYAEGLSEKNPIYTIFGRVDDINGNGLKAVEIWITKGQDKIKITTDNYGNFEYTATESGTYNIKIVLPFAAQIVRNLDGFYLPEGNEFKITRKENQTTVEYDTEFEPNSCLYRNFSFDKKQKIPLSK